MQAPATGYDIWNKLSESLANVTTSISQNSFFKTLDQSNAVELKNQRLFFETATQNQVDTSSALARPFLRSFLATKEFYMNNQRQILSILSKLLGLSISAVTSYLLLKWFMKTLDPTNADKLSAKTRAEKIMKLIGISNIELNEYELFIASNITLPKDIDCSWQDIGGLDHIIDDLRETVIYPLKNFESISKSSITNNFINKRSRLIQPPKGVLLFGPPGNAKTMIAKALAKESGARFINLQVSTLFDKWFGESQKRTEAIFSLAAKVQPVIIFIDEIDSFLRSRRTDDHECTSTMKTQFMTLWDGLGTSQKENRILIIGATNRPEDVDPAILRRMPQMFYIGLPNENQRRKILDVILKEETLANDVDLNEIAEKTEGYSGSDLHELCRCAAMNSFITALKKVNSTENTFRIEQNNNSNPVTTQNAIRKIDFEVGFEKMAVKNMANKNRFDFATARGFF